MKTLNILYCMICVCGILNHIRLKGLRPRVEDGEGTGLIKSKRVISRSFPTFLNETCPVTFHYTPHSRFRCKIQTRINQSDTSFVVHVVNITHESRHPPPLSSKKVHTVGDLEEERYWLYHKKKKKWRTTFGSARRRTEKEIRRVHQHFSQKKEQYPNVYIFLFDSTSRELFHRQVPTFLNALQQKVSKVNATLVEFLRYSTIGWGTAPNTKILYRGCGLIPGGTRKYRCNSSHATLSSLYGSYGYALLGGADLYESPESLYLGEIPDKFVSRGCKYGTSGTALMVDRFVKLYESTKEMDPSLPQYFAIHESENHGGSGICDQCLMPLLDVIDLEHSILVLTADHGKRYGKTKSAESSNPLSLISLPNSFVTPILLANQDKLVTHWDIHEMLSTLLPPKSPDAYCKSLKNCSWRTKPCPLLKYPWAINPRITAVDPSRTCEEAMAFNKYCYCNRASAKIVLANTPFFQTSLHEIIWNLNAYTGNGTKPCHSFVTAEFEITDIKKHKNNFELILAKKRQNKPRFLVFLTLSGRLMFYTNSYGQEKMPHIVRLDKFGKMPCLGDMGEDEHPPLFQNNSLNHEIWVNGSYSQDWNLRWCYC